MSNAFLLALSSNPHFPPIPCQDDFKCFGAVGDGSKCVHDDKNTSVARCVDCDWQTFKQQCQTWPETFRRPAEFTCGSAYPCPGVAIADAQCPGLPSYFTTCDAFPGRRWPEMCCDTRYQEALPSMCKAPPAGICVNVTLEDSLAQQLPGAAIGAAGTHTTTDDDAACPGLPGVYMSCDRYPDRAWPTMCCDGRYDEALPSMCKAPATAPPGVCLNVTTAWTTAKLVTIRKYNRLTGDGDCCPTDTACAGGSGPYAVSTGDDYPDDAMAKCDSIPGCVAVGQMYSCAANRPNTVPPPPVGGLVLTCSSMVPLRGHRYVTRYHFATKEGCVEASKVPGVAFDFECAEQPAAPGAYGSVVAVRAKAPWACYAVA